MNRLEILAPNLSSNIEGHVTEPHLQRRSHTECCSESTVANALVRWVVSSVCRFAQLAGKSVAGAKVSRRYVLPVSARAPQNCKMQGWWPLCWIMS